ncbi:MAG: hypothetical protein AB3N16_08120 [Flavobacteriaceae bacterium]
MGKNAGKLAWAVLALVGLYSCTAYRASRQYQKLQQPKLGTVVQQHGTLGLVEHTQEVGQLQLKRPLAVKVVALPFNNHSYSRYTTYLKNARTANSVPYNDSLPMPPRYVQLQLANQVQVTQLLNAPENQALCDYIAQDPKHALVSSICFTGSDENLATFINATHVFLVQDDLGKPYFKLLQEANERIIYFEELQIFDSEKVSFCWSEDQYLEKRVVNLLEKGQRCPKGTYKKARKAERKRDYLKL